MLIRNSNLRPLKIYNGQSHPYYIDLRYGKSITKNIQRANECLISGYGSLYPYSFAVILLAEENMATLIAF